MGGSRMSLIVGMPEFDGPIEIRASKGLVRGAIFRAIPGRRFAQWTGSGLTETRV